MAAATPSFCIRMAKRFVMSVDIEERRPLVFTQDQRRFDSGSLPVGEGDENPHDPAGEFPD
jgi:hypothetical protein